MLHRVAVANERLLRPAGIAALVVGTLLLVIVAAGSSIVSLRTERATVQTRSLQHDRDVALAALLSLERAETGQRGYLLTGRDRYLATYQAAVELAPARLEELASSRPGDPAVSRMVDLARNKLAELARTIELADAGRHDDALALVQQGTGQRLMEEYRTLSARLTQSENQALGDLVERTRRETRVLVWLDVLSVAVVLVMAAQVASGVRRAVSLLRAAEHDLAAANDELSNANDTLEQAVRHRTAELTHANDEIQRFAYIVSHDLRSPLVNVMGFTSELQTAQAAVADYLAGRDMPDPVRQAVVEDMPEALRFIRASTAKMDRLIHAILRLSREGRRRLTPERIDMVALLRGVADTMAHPATSAGATVEVGDAPPVISDRLALEQVFGNLLENALKYAKPGRPARVEIRGERAGSRVRYAVVDNGRGIAERDLERVFELFRRAGDQSVPGEGIGLAHVRALVRRLGGTISCTSEFGVGTIFTVELPAQADQQSDQAS